MGEFPIGDAKLFVTPVTFMKLRACFIRGVSETFALHCLEPIFRYPNQGDLAEFCEYAIETISAARRRLPGVSDRLWSEMNKATRRLRDAKYRRRVQREAKHFAERVSHWMRSPLWACAACAVERMAAWGSLSECREVLGTARLGRDLVGVFLPIADAVVVWLDAVEESAVPELSLLQTFLHEQVHAAVQSRMGPNRRLELAWLEELAAELTSYTAIAQAARESLEPAMLLAAESALAEMQNTSRCAALIEAVLRETGDPLLPWRAWQEVFALPLDDRRHYGLDRFITPILRKLGWDVTFPYYFGDQCVTVHGAPHFRPFPNGWLDG